MDRGVWHAAVHGVTKSQTRLSNLIELNLLRSFKIKNIKLLKGLRRACAIRGWEV